MHEINGAGASAAHCAIPGGATRVRPGPPSLVFGLLLWIGGHSQFNLAPSIDDRSYDARTTPGRAISAEDLVQLPDIGTRLGGRFALSPDGGEIALLPVPPSVRAHGYEITWPLVPP